jgi:hypothetical protein
MSSPEDCGMEIIDKSKTSGFVETTHYYMPESEQRLKCYWLVSTKCDKLEWMFDKFDFNDKAGVQYYDSIFNEGRDTNEDVDIEKVFNCLSDNVQVTYGGQSKTKKFCAIDDINDYEDEDFNSLYDDPANSKFMDWTLVNGSELKINYSTKHLIYGFKLNWRCSEK